MARKRETVSRCTTGKRTVFRLLRRNCLFRDYEQAGFFRAQQHITVCIKFIFFTIIIPGIIIIILITIITIGKRQYNSTYLARSREKIKSVG